MKRILLWICLLAAFSGALAEETLFSAEGLTVSLEAAAVDEGEAAVTLTVANARQEARTVWLFAPEINSAPAAFPRGRTTLPVELGAGEQVQVECVILPDDAWLWPQDLSLRAAVDGRLTTPMYVLLADDDLIAWPADFDTEYVVCEAVASPQDLPASDLVLEDRAPTSAAGLDYALAHICIREDGADGAVYTPVVALPVEVDEAGVARAAFSGLVPVLTTAPDFALPATETCVDGERHWQIDGIALYSEAIYFAEMSVDIAWRDGEPAVVEQPVEAEEFGRATPGAPLRLFDELFCSIDCFQAAEEDGQWRQWSVGSRSTRLAIESPVALALTPAHTFGELYCYFEYFYDDQTSQMHAPTALEDA